MTTPYVYKLKDLETGKFYFGVRYSAGCSPEDLGVSYFTSSKIVRPLFKQNPNRFSKQIIVTGSADHVIKVEKSLIDFYGAVYSEEFYNRANARAVHIEDMVSGGLKTRDEKLGFHAFTFEQFSEHNRKNGAGSLANRKGVHARSKEQMRLDGLKSFDLGVGVHSRTFEQQSETGRRNGLKAAAEKTGMFSLTKEQRVEIGKASGHLSSVRRFKCSECELVSTSAGMGNHSKKTGHTGKSQTK